MSSAYIGVYFNRSSGKWAARRVIGGKMRYLGSHKTPLSAWVAIELAKEEYEEFGEKAFDRYKRTGRAGRRLQGVSVVRGGWVE